MQYTFYQPEYFLKFRCIGSACACNCCDFKWDITWSEEEYNRLITAPDISDDFISSIKENIIINDNGQKNYKIKMNDDGRCPFQNRETNLCDIQKELGEEYLSEVCKNYPRSFLMMDNKVLRQCTSSCPAVIKLLMHDKKAMQMEELPIRNLSVSKVHCESPAKLARIPYLQYRKAIIEFYSWLFTSGKNIETSLLSGALAAKNISDLSTSGFAINIPAVLAQLKDEWRAKDPDIHSEKIVTDYKVKHKYLYPLLKDIKDLPFDINILNDTDSIDETKYTEGKNRFCSSVTNPEIALNNISMNIFLNLFITLDLIDKSFFKFYVYYALCASALLYLAYTSAYIGKDTENDFITSASLLCRKLMHSHDASKEIFDHIDQFSSPDLLAIIIK